MPRINCHKTYLLLLALLLAGAGHAYANDDTQEALNLLTGTDEQLVTTSRIPRPVSKIAENVTVITAEEISRLNAHTLADVLQTIPGIQLDYLRSPGTFAFFNIQGALNTTVLVMVDGVRQNNFAVNDASPSLIPVQQIERIEIVKGAASTTWGSALGGVINIVTKEPNPDTRATGMVSGSIGSRFTTDSRGELNGTVDAFGYYLSAGNLHSDGLTPNTGGSANNVFAKLSYDLPTKGKVTLGYSYFNSEMGMDEGMYHDWAVVHDNMKNRRTNGYIKLSQPLAPHLTLDLDAYATNRDDHIIWGHFSDGSLIMDNDGNKRESSRGGAAQLIWGDSHRNLTAGVEYGHVEAKSFDTVANPTDPLLYDRTWDSWAFYGNGAYSLGPLTLLGGVRMDLTGIAGNNLSGTLGATCRLGDKTTLRAYWSPQGFALPNLVYHKDGKLQKIRTVQAGIETEAIPFLWLKGTWFYNVLSNISESLDSVTNQRREGFEIEARTAHLFGLSLSGGYTYLYAHDSDTGTRLQSDGNRSVPPHVIKTALRYDHNPWGVHGTLTGNYAWWNGSNAYFANQGMVWDLHLNWQILPASELSPELFFTAHNLFNANVTIDYSIYSTPTLWFDGGVRFKF